MPSFGMLHALAFPTLQSAVDPTSIHHQSNDHHQNRAHIVRERCHRESRIQLHQRFRHDLSVQKTRESYHKHRTAHTVDEEKERAEQNILPFRSSAREPSYDHRTRRSEKHTDDLEGTSLLHTEKDGDHDCDNGLGSLVIKATRLHTCQMDATWAGAKESPTMKKT